jgi:hypothetical protein
VSGSTGTTADEWTTVVIGRDWLMVARPTAKDNAISTRMVSETPTIRVYFAKRLTVPTAAVPRLAITLLLLHPTRLRLAAWCRPSWPVFTMG